MALLSDLAVLIRGLRPGGRVLVGVDGPDAAGKTTFARNLTDVLDRIVIQASIDAWHRPGAERMHRGAMSPEGYYRDSFDHEALASKLLDPFASGRDTVSTAHFDHRSDSKAPEAATRLRPDAVLLFEGVFLLRPELRDRWDLVIHLHVPESVTLARAAERDIGVFGDLEAVRSRYEQRYLPGQELYRAEARQHRARSGGQQRAPLTTCPCVAASNDQNLWMGLGEVT